MRARSTKSHYSASVDDHIARTSGEATSVEQTSKTGEAPEPVAPGLHEALHRVGTELMKGGPEPASLGSIGFAFRHVAAQIKPQAPDIGRSVAPKAPSTPEIGPDTSGLFGTPGPERV